MEDNVREGWAGIFSLCLSEGGYENRRRALLDQTKGLACPAFFCFTQWPDRCSGEATCPGHDNNTPPPLLAHQQMAFRQTQPLGTWGPASHGDGGYGSKDICLGENLIEDNGIDARGLVKTGYGDRTDFAQLFLAVCAINDFYLVFNIYAYIML